MNIIFKCIMLGVLALLTDQQVSAQSVPNVISPSPNTAALMRYAEIPVDYSTGVPAIEVPLYTLSSGKLKLPLKLTYHASGNKVQDIASTVGLGWVLQAGGVVTCTVMGKPDEMPFNNYYTSSNDIQTKISQDISNGNGATSKYNLDRMFFANDYETQSDRYTYSFNGYSGVFRYDFGTSALHKMPYRPIEIKRLFNGTSPYFEIIAEDGTRYLFETGEGTQYTGTWLLSKIISADNKDEIQLYYKTGDIVFQFKPSYNLAVGDTYPMTESGGALDVSPHPEKVLTNNSLTEGYSTLVLDYITSNEAKVVFDYATDVLGNNRPDATRKRLTKMTVFNKNTNEKLREIALNQSFFGTAAENNQRLRLDAVNVSGSDGTPVETTSFGYNTTALPAYPGVTNQVFHEDYWGYYNGKDNPTLIPRPFLPNDLDNLYYGGDLDPHAELVKASVLEEIRYPTGGKTVFEFEPNNGAIYSYSNSTVAGGLRVKTISSYADNTSTPVVKSYEYLTVGAGPNITQEYFHYEMPYQFLYYALVHGEVIRNTVKDIYTSSSHFTLNPGNSISVVYSLVKENIGNPITGITGYTTYEYDLPPFYSPDIAGGHPRFLAANHFDRGNFEPKLLHQTEYRNINNLFSAVKSTDNTYTAFRQSEFLTGFTINRTSMSVIRGEATSDYIPVIPYLNGFSTYDTKGYDDVSLLTKTETRDLSDPNNPVVQSTNYNYGNNEHLQVTSREATRSNENKLLTTFKYPHDFDGIQPYTDMVHTKHMWNPVIEQNDYKNTTADFLQSTQTSYSDWGSDIIAVNTISSKSKGAVNYEPRVTYHSYDNLTGNVLSVSKSGGPLASYVWGYNGQYPIAEVKNAGLNEIYTQDFEQGELDFELNMPTTTARSHTGKYSGVLGNSGTEEVSSHSNKYLTIAPGTARLFTYSGWVYSDGPSVDLFLFMYRAGEQNYYSYVDAASTSQTGKWTYVKKTFLVPADVVKMRMRVDNNSAGTVWYDDLRIHPSDAQMSTYTFNPLVGMTSQTDTKGQTLYYDYDALQRLIRVKDQNGNLLKSNDYHYKN